MFLAVGISVGGAPAKVDDTGDGHGIKEGGGLGVVIGWKEVTGRRCSAIYPTYVDPVSMDERGN